MYNLEDLKLCQKDRNWRVRRDLNPFGFRTLFKKDEKCFRLKIGVGREKTGNSTIKMQRSILIKDKKIRGLRLYFSFEFYPDVVHNKGK